MSRRRILLTTLLAVFFAFLAMLYSRIINPHIFRSPSSFFPFRTQSTTHMAQPSTTTASTRGPVIVVGSGLAGLCASYEALRAGASVRMIDRAAKPGGNSIKASSGINGAGSRFQQAKGITDHSFRQDTIRSAGKRYAEWEKTREGVDRGGLVDLLTESSGSAVEWLVDEIGVELSVVAMLGGHTVARTHRGAGKLPPGAALVSAFLAKLKEDPNFALESGAQVTEITQQADGAVIGVEYTHQGETHRLRGPVMFATGGFAGDAHGQMAKYRPDLRGMPATAEARPGTHALLSAVGAGLVDMDSVQIHPTGFVDPADRGSMSKFLAAEMLRGEGGILLGPAGTRFVDELQTRDRLSEAIMALPPRRMPATALIFANYGHWSLPAGEANRDLEVVVGRITPVVHFTMGGVAFDARARVLAATLDKPIPGLFAAGEVTGGLHGDNRLGGSSLLECVVYGRIAGREAAKLLA
ncbi:unnamed protein product [Parascedosporium putredinis]|uniref:FAD-dependent oxidoreductase 2 FAD-binding domain-containing protein n=1 Tax=Parascedosporium putredinis TaxID=1442378 RepID=A0A9P1HAY3_9PEZI|nr:unnamed protein product [Parascedosporium putredinis]CAI8003344.1 unnamed protein product [Parascedosporium putredinis]